LKLVKKLEVGRCWKC